MKSKEKDPHKRELLEVTFRNAKRLQQLTEDILDVTRIESQSLHLRKQRFNLSKIISEVIEDSKNQIKQEYKKNLEIVLLSEGDIFVEADRSRIYQVILNLLNNAIKFTEEVDGITITTEEKIDNNNNHVVVVGVKDNGQGINGDISQRLFTKFATKSKTGGTGLGLYISKSIVEAHGGRIWAVNNNKVIEGQRGATFYFTLPIVKVSATDTRVTRK